jgi:hypothetical protein
MKNSADAEQQNAPHAENRAEIGTGDADQHLPDAEARRHPGAFVEAEMQAAAQVGDAEGGDAAAERRHDRAEQHAENADIGTQRVGAQARMTNARSGERRPRAGEGRVADAHGCFAAGAASRRRRAARRRCRSSPRPTCRAAPARRARDSLSSAIFTGTRCTTLVKLPVALSGGSSAKVLPVPGDQLSTWPVSTRSGNASTVTRAAGRGAHSSSGSPCSSRSPRCWAAARRRSPACRH